MPMKCSLISGAVLLAMLVTAVSPILGQPGSKVVADGLCAKGRAAFQEESFEKAATFHREALEEYTPSPQAAVWVPA